MGINNRSFPCLTLGHFSDRRSWYPGPETLLPHLRATRTRAIAQGSTTQLPEGTTSATYLPRTC